MPASVSIPFHSLGSSLRCSPASRVRVFVRQGIFANLLTRIAHGDLCIEQLEERDLAHLQLLFTVVEAFPDCEPLVRFFTQDMKLGQQTR